jgi:predicted Zn-dependent peptidase
MQFGRLRSDQAHIAIATPAPGFGASDAYASQLFADVVGAGSSSRLFQQLREETEKARKPSGRARISAEPECLDHAADRANAELVHREIERVLQETADGVEQREIERARAMAKAGMMMSLESCWGQASYLATRLLREGELLEPADIVARLDAVTNRPLVGARPARSATFVGALPPSAEQ